MKLLVVPGSAGAHVGVAGTFAIAEFCEASDIAYLDTAVQAQITDHPEIVKKCIEVFDILRAEACR